MKRYIAIALAVCLTVCLSACAGEKAEDTNTTVSTVVTSATTSAPQTTKTDAAGVLHTDVHLTGKRSEVFELPLSGATGFASYPLSVYAATDKTGKVLVVLQPGDAFTVLEEQGDFWRISTENRTVGWVEYATCYLNIADVIPSVVLKNTNASASAFLSSGVAIPEITGEQLYNGKFRNDRFGDQRFVMAANYHMVKKIYAAQQEALKDGYTLVINETFRPFDVQLKISQQLAELRLNNTAVKAGIDKSPWGIGWFISNRLSTHQMGCAMDVSLGKVQSIDWELCGEYLYPTVTSYIDCTMPTPIHELSAAAISLEKPVNSYSPTAWKSIQPAGSMTADALRLRGYCVDAGMSPLASEWWHFNDLDTKERVGDRYVSDVFYLDACCSQIPD